MRIDRRAFMALAGGAAYGAMTSPDHVQSETPLREKAGPADQGTVSLFLCGDVMTARGIDQILLHPGDPEICEPHVKSALTYLKLAEEASGPIPRPASFRYIWGDALDELERAAPDARIINLETSVTAHGRCTDRGISYRMNPANIPCIAAGGIDCCVLANNHVLDWGHEGFLETLESLTAAGLRFAGAGHESEEAAAPAVLDLPRRRNRILVFAAGVRSSGIPPGWAATETGPGVNFLEDLSNSGVARMAERVKQFRQSGDIAIASIHWGGNWGYDIPSNQREFAHGLIDRAGIDLVHGHSSHHVKGIEVYKGRPIFYGCGDFLNDYEGIKGYERYRDDLVLMYFPTVALSDYCLVRCRMVPLRIRNFRLNRASREEVEWLRDVLNREGRPFGTTVDTGPDGDLFLNWV